MTLLFTRRRHLGSWLIRMVTWSDYSHVDIVLGGGMLIGATAPHGVRLSRLEDRLSKASKAVMMDISRDLTNPVFDFLFSQMAKPYDWLGVLGIGLHRNWQEDTRWSCAELAAKTLSVAGHNPFDDKFQHRITPQDLLMLKFVKRRVK